MALGQLLTIVWKPTMDSLHETVFAEKASAGGSYCLQTIADLPAKRTGRLPIRFVWFCFIQRWQVRLKELKDLSQGCLNPLWKGIRSSFLSTSSAGVPHRKTILTSTRRTLQWLYFFEPPFWVDDVCKRHARDFIEHFIDDLL